LEPEKVHAFTTGYEKIIDIKKTYTTKPIPLPRKGGYEYVVDGMEQG
jgi:hypothetical protein